MKNKEKIIKVKFNKTYIGDLGRFYKGSIYELAYELYEVFKNDCEVVK
jgi:hypothetical protein